MAEADVMDVDVPSSSTSSGTGKKRFEVKKVLEDKKSIPNFFLTIVRCDSQF